MKNRETAYTDFTWNGGKMVILNVPVVVIEGESFFPGSVSLRLSELAEYMEEEGLRSLEYEGPFK